MVNVYLLRHGQTAYNAAGNRYCGRTDIPLTQTGITQAENLHEQLKDIKLDAIYSSPLQRAFNTARLATGSDDVKTDDRLIEVDFGNWENKTREEFVLENPVLWTNWLNDPQNNRAGGIGESGAEVILRLDSFYADMLAKHNGETILITGHNGINRLFMAHKLGMPLSNYQRLQQENSAITMFEISENDGFILKKLNA